MPSGENREESRSFATLRMTPNGAEQLGAEGGKRARGEKDGVGGKHREW